MAADLPGVAPSGVLRDARLREALAASDLVAAVRVLMACEHEDHCADTRLVCLVENLPAERLGELPAVLEANRNNDFVIRFLLSAWSERDPAGALAWVEKHPLNASGERAFLPGWTRNDPEAALAWLDSQPASQRATRFRAAYIEALSESNPAAALDLLKNNGWFDAHPAGFVALAHNWAGRDPEGALDALRDMIDHLGLPSQESATHGAHNSHGKHQAWRVLLGALLSGAFNRDPAAAVALAARLTPEEMATGVQAVAKEVLARHPAGAPAILSALPLERRESLFRELGNQESEIVASLFRHLPDDSDKISLLQHSLRPRLFEGVSASLADMDRGELNRLAASISDPDQRERLSAKLSATLAGTDPQWALDLWQHVSEANRAGYEEILLASLARKDPQKALEWHASLPEDQRQEQFKLLCCSLAQAQPATALELLRQSPSGPAQAEAAASLFAAWAARDAPVAFAALDREAAHLDLPAVLEALPRAARFQTGASSISQHIETGKLADHLNLLQGNSGDDSQLIEEARRANDPRQNHDGFSPIYTTVNALQQWAQSDPQAAIAFLDTIDDTSLRAVLTGQMAGALSRVDSAAAVALLNDMPGDQLQAVPLFAREWACIDAEATWRWAGRIDDPEMRAAARETVLSGLATSEPAHALRLARDSGDESLQQTTLHAVRAALQWNPGALNRLSEAFPEPGGVAKR